MDIIELLENRILVIDGAMGTMVQRYKLKEEDFKGKAFAQHQKLLQGNNDLLSITQPDIIKEIHQQYLIAGADILETNTFSATTIAQADYGLEDAVYDINKNAALIAKKATKEYMEANKGSFKFVAGAIGPTNKTASLSPDVNDPGFRATTFDELAEAYSQQITALIDGGVDLLLVETVFDVLNAKAALYAANQVMEKKETKLPLMVSGTITDASGRTLSGQTVEAFWNSVQHADLLSVGLNCALGAKDMRPYMEELSEKAWVYTSCYPNAGLPNEFGEYDQTPETMRNLLAEFMQDGFINIIGGCCGTTPEHIAAIAEVAKKHQPRKAPVLAI